MRRPRRDRQRTPGPRCAAVLSRRPLVRRRPRGVGVMTGYPTLTAATLCDFAREVLSDERMRSQGLHHGAPGLSDPKA